MRRTEHSAARAGGPAPAENPAGLNRRGFLTAAGALLAAGHASQAGARAPGPGPGQRDWSLHAGCALVARETGAGAKLERDVHLLIR
ncbi:MAG: hypothetical protein V2I24_09125, partial [Halieaceae bacterium]|nr:hypothetical protein [Halieaceae bacterium]